MTTLITTLIRAPTLILLDVPPLQVYKAIINQSIRDISQTISNTVMDGSY